MVTRRKSLENGRSRAAYTRPPTDMSPGSAKGISKTALIVALGFVVLLVAAAGMALLGGWEGDALASNAPPALASAESRAAALPAATTSRPQDAPLARAEAVSDDDPFGALKLDGGSFELVGRVVGTDGKPIAKATAQLFIANFPMLAPPAVELMRSNGMRVEELLKKTGPDGIFKLRSTFTDGNDYLLLVKAPNAAPVARRGMNIERGAVADVGDIVMEAGYQVSGRVLDPSNNPVLAARVVAVPTPNWTSVERFLENAEPQDFMATDDHGEFTIPNLADGRYTIVAWAKGLARARRRRSSSPRKSRRAPSRSTPPPARGSREPW